jgi:hypothetical protein
MICCLTLTRLARWPRVAVRGVSLLSTLGLVSIWYSGRHELVMFGFPWWKPQRGQNLIEYALLLGLGGGLCWVAWSTLVLVVTRVFCLWLSSVSGYSPSCLGVISQ